MSSLLDDAVPHNQADQEMHMDPLSQSVKDNDFEFQQVLAVHSGSVRCVTVLPNTDTLISGSIDTSCKMYQIDKSTGKYAFDREFKYHDSFIYDVHPNVSSDGFYSASKDRKVMHIDSEGNPKMVFEGHENCVNSLSQSIPEELVTGSWDGTARIWDTATGQVKSVLDGHQHAVAVLSLPNNVVITGSQDKAIRIWFQGTKQKEVAEAHGDIIRQFTEVPGFGFASCSNDETVKMWAIDGTLLQTFKGHMGFVFAVTTLITGEIVSAGDDCSVKIWTTDGKCKQTIAMPRTVWSLAQNSIGDLIVGTEDYKVRTFTRDPARAEKGEDLQEFLTEVQSKTTGNDMSQFDKAPDVSEQSKMVGKTEGDIQVFKKNGVPSAYMWKMAERKWEYVGEVVDPNAGAGAAGMEMASQTKVYPGDAMFPAGEYDHVFDIELGDNVMRKLPFNNGGNALDAAEKFCIRESIGRANVEQIRSHIGKHSLPYATREVPGAAGSNVEEEKDNTMRTVLLYDTVKIDGPKKKILEFNSAGNMLDDKQLKHFEGLCEQLCNKDKYYLTKLNDYHTDVMSKLIVWPTDKVFPCLDLYRIFLLHPDATLHFKKFEDGAAHLAAVASVLTESGAADPAILLSLRCIVNMFSIQSANFVLRERRQKVIDAVSGQLKHAKANIRESAITVLLNFSIIFLQKDDSEGKIQALSALGALAGRTDLDEQSKKRMQAAVNNLTYKNPDGKELAQALGLNVE